MAGAPKAFFALAILFVLATSQAHALTVAGINVNQLVLTGLLSCSANGANTGGSPPLANARVNLNVNGITIASVLTAPNGTFTIRVSNLSLLNGILSVSNLRIRVNLPVATCPILSTVTGALEGVPLVQGGVVNGVLNLVTGTLTQVA